MLWVVAVVASKRRLDQPSSLVMRESPVKFNNNNNLLKFKVRGLAGWGNATWGRLISIMLDNLGVYGVTLVWLDYSGIDNGCLCVLSMVVI